MESWTLVFCDPEPLPEDSRRRDRLCDWALRAFLKPGFRHVFALRPALGFEGWLVINPHSGALDIIEVQGSDYWSFLLSLEGQGKVRLLRFASRRKPHWHLRPVFSCVATVAHLLGLPESFGWKTPWALYCALKDQGAEAIFETTEYQKEECMGGMFGSKPDTSAADEAREKAEKERDEVKKKNEARIRNLQNRSRGRSLLAFAGEQGVADGLKTKLGE